MLSKQRNKAVAARRRVGAKGLADPSLRQVPKVLIVDDDPGVTDGLKRALRNDAVVLSANGGREAIEILGQTSAVDVVVLDITMPQFDSVETLEAMSQAGHILPVILFTGYRKSLMSTVKGYAECLKLHVLATLEKPVEPSAILHILKNQAND